MAKKPGKLDKHGHNFVIFSQATGQTWNHTSAYHLSTLVYYRNVALGEKVTKACVTPSETHKIFFKGPTTLPLCKSETSEFCTFKPALNGHKKHKRIRRGKRGKNKTIEKSANQLCNIYYANVNGFRSKSESIKQLIQEKAIDILILTENKVYTKSVIQLDGFQMFPVVRGKSDGGGLLIAVSMAHALL